jgi:hypothetical protein
MTGIATIDSATIDSATIGIATIAIVIETTTPTAIATIGIAVAETVPTVIPTDAITGVTATTAGTIGEKTTASTPLGGVEATLEAAVAVTTTEIPTTVDSARGRLPCAVGPESL